MSTPRPARTALTRAHDEYLAHLRVERGLSPNTLAAYRHDLDRYLEFLTSQGITDPEAITANHVSTMVQRLRQGTKDTPALAPSSAARATVTIRGWHKFMAAEGTVIDNVAGDIAPPAVGKRLPKALSVDEVSRLLQAVNGNDAAALRDRALLEMLYATGARISEAVGLTIDDLDRESGCVRLFGKGRKERIVPMGQYAWDAMDRYLVQSRPHLAEKGQGNASVFVNLRGNPLSRQSAWGIIQHAAEAAELTTHISPHVLRHSFATHVLHGGADVRVVQEMLGHASVTTTQIYTLVTVDQLREVYAMSHPRARG
ncbi:site-specific tyrosine recombinase XerD [Actinomyces vulturis]|uniref:site-specific tyrosine recombinase XerD n=1 Tax=Actinomyces vulturis TaxID=1857645 RepID=UPI00082F4B0C|nr:site-specific tyrosine recombinase XerD [Actinomyces vulturis]